jgi:hypothetical protein
VTIFDLVATDCGMKANHRVESLEALPKSATRKKRIPRSRAALVSTRTAFDNDNESKLYFSPNDGEHLTLPEDISEFLQELVGFLPILCANGCEFATDSRFS